MQSNQALQKRKKKREGGGLIYSLSNVEICPYNILKLKLRETQICINNSAGVWQQHRAAEGAAESLIGLVKAQPSRFIGGNHLHTPNH